MRLSDLLKGGRTRSAAESQTYARERFWELVGESGIKRWRKGDERPRLGRWVLIGLAPAYSIPDLELAEKIVKTARDTRRSTEFQFFDFLDVVDNAEMQDYVPIEKVFSTPVVGVWQDGNLVRSAQGFAGRQLALETLSGA